MARATMLRRLPLTGGDVEKRESESGKQAQLAIAERQLCFDRFLQDCQQLPVDEIEGVDHGQYAECVEAGRAAEIWIL